MSQSCDSDERKNAKFFAAKAQIFLSAEHVHEDSAVIRAKIGSTGGWDSDKFYLRHEVVVYQMFALGFPRKHFPPLVLTLELFAVRLLSAIRQNQ